MSLPVLKIPAALRMMQPPDPFYHIRYASTYTSGEFQYIVISFVL